MNAKEKAIKSLEGFRLNVVLSLDVDYDVYKTDDIEKAIDIAIKEVLEDVEYTYNSEGIDNAIIERIKECHLSTFSKEKGT